MSFYESRLDGYFSCARYTAFEALVERTRLTDKWQLDMGLPKLLEPLAANRAKSGVRENLEKLKELLELGRVTLQDGRSFTRYTPILSNT
jgi:hypothetical protein